MIKKYLKKFSPVTSHQSPVTGFTLIELLVVISIIGVLTSIATSRYIVAEKQARDTRRKSDLNQYRLALENYAVVYNSLYPTPAVSTCVYAATSLCSDSFKTTFIPACPEDSRREAASPTHYYWYCGSSESYTLSSMLEISGKIWQVCSNGQSCLSSLTDYPTGNTCACQ